MGWRRLLVATVMLAACSAVRAQSHTGTVGRTATPEEIAAWNITISDTGKGLPAGSGTAVQGAPVYMGKCAVCHGVNGRGGLAPNVIIDKDPHATSPRARRVMVTRVPFAPVLWDYINRAMPLKLGPGTLKPDEVYALTAFLLYQNEVIGENDVMDSQTLAKVKMPNRDGFVPPATEDWHSPAPMATATKSNPVTTKK